MKKITEASTLSALGIPDDVVKKIHTEFRLTLKHDHEFEELKTKGQMQTKLKGGKLIIGFSPNGEIASIREGSTRGTRYYGTIDTKELDSSGSIKDMLSNFTGKGWKWFATVDSWRDKPFYKFRRQGTPNFEKHDAFKDKLERVHGPKLRKEAAQYAEDVKDFLVAFAAGDEVKVDKHKWRGDADPNDLYMGGLRRAMHNLRKVASSETPHSEFSSKGIADLIDQNVGEPKTDYDFQKIDDKSGKYMRNAKLGTAKVAQLFLRKLRAYRDNAIDAAKKERASTTDKRSLGMVKKAWESYKESGEVNILSDGKWDYKKQDKGKGAGITSPMYDGGADNRKSRKAFRKKKKAEAHAARMRGEVEESRYDVEQIPVGDADYSNHSTALLKTMLEPGALHPDERGFKKLIRAELKRRTKGKGK